MITDLQAAVQQYYSLWILIPYLPPT